MGWPTEGLNTWPEREEPDGDQTPSMRQGTAGRVDEGAEVAEGIGECMRERSGEHAGIRGNGAKKKHAVSPLLPGLQVRVGFGATGLSCFATNFHTRVD